MESSGSSSDSDDGLEDVGFLSNPSPGKSQTSTVNTEPTNKENAVQSVGGRLDMLLLNHKDELVRDEMHQKMKAQLLNSIAQGSQDVSFGSDAEELNGDLAEYIEELEVKSPSLPTGHPTVTVFNPDQFCCLFRENINPYSCGFSGSHSSHMDKVLDTIKSEDVIPMLQSNILLSCSHQVSKLDAVMMWLFSLLSIHSSPLVAKLCSKNIEGIIQNYNPCDNGDGSFSLGKSWCPKPIELVRILVNMGASPTDILSGQTLYTDEHIKEHLSAENDENNASTQKSPGKVNMGNFRHLLEILTKCLQRRPNLSQAELDVMLNVIIKVSFDEMFQDLGFQRTFQSLLSSLLDCYSEADWPSVVPALCHQLRAVIQHHHHAVYLSELMPCSPRGNYFQIRLSFLLMCSVLEPERKEELSSLQLENVSPLAIAWLGHEGSNSPDLSQLYICLQHLVKEDVYKLNSAVTLLDRAVGDEINRKEQPKGELQYLTNQVKHVIKDIRDSFHTLDLSRITMKDKMIIMTVKWMRMSAQNTKSVQRSMFSYVDSSSHMTVTEKILKDDLRNTEADDIDLDF